MASSRLPTPISCGVILSYRCTIECRHCMYACSPKWREWISKEQLTQLLHQLAGKIEPAPYGPGSVGLNHGLHFTGGEPFLDFDLLLEGTKMADELGIPSTFVETNCYWCTADDTTRDKLEQLAASVLERVRDNNSGSFAVWTYDSRRRRRYMTERHALALCWMSCATNARLTAT